jgi:nucleoid DNA-binding protein
MGTITKKELADRIADSVKMKRGVVKGIVQRFLDEMKVLEALRRQIASRVKAALDLEARVALVEPKSLRRVVGGKGCAVDRRPG